MKLKKLLKLAAGGIGGALLLSIVAVLPTLAADKTTMATTAPLNMRDAAGTQGSVITTIPKGTSVEVFSMTNAGWYNVKYDGKEGYCYYVYLDFEGTEDGTVKDGNVTTMYATAPLNIRAEANTNSKIIGCLAVDEGVEVFAKNDGWFSVQYNGMEGYCHGSYLNFGQSDKNSSDDTSGSVMNNLTTTAPLNVREEPNTNAKIIGSFKKGENVKILAEEGDWYKVKYGDKVGYSHGAYFK